MNTPTLTTCPVPGGLFQTTLTDTQGETIAMFFGETKERAEKRAGRFLMFEDLVDGLRNSFADLEAYTEWHNAKWPDSEKEDCARLTRNIEQTRHLLEKASTLNIDKP